MNVSERLDELNQLAAEVSLLEREAERATRIADEISKRRREWAEKGVAGDAPGALRFKLHAAYRTWIDDAIEDALDRLLELHLPSVMRVAELQFRAKAKERRAAADLVRSAIRAALVENDEGRSP
jgi:hypothetical protein